MGDLRCACGLYSDRAVTLSTSEPSLAESALLSEESLESERRRADSNLARGFEGAVAVPGAVVDMVNM